MSHQAQSAVRGNAPAARSGSASEAPASGGHRAQLRGQTFAEQEAMLRPPGPGHMQRTSAAQAAPTKGAASKAVDERAADQAFTAWVAEHDRLVAAGKRPPAPSEDAKWSWALDHVKESIKPLSLPEGYRPPPLRGKADMKGAGPPKGGGAEASAGSPQGTQQEGGAQAEPKASPPPSAEDYERYRKNAELGRRYLQETVTGLELFPELAPRYAREAYLKAVKKGWRCQKDAAGDARIVAEVRREYGLDAPAGPTLVQGEPGDVERAKKQSEAGAQLLKDLDWARANPVGSGAYGVSRTLGKNHEGSMIVARQIQGLFDIASNGPGEAETLKNKSHEDVTTAQGNLPDRGRQYRR